MLHKTYVASTKKNIFVEKQNEKRTNWGAHDVDICLFTPRDFRLGRFCTVSKTCKNCFARDESGTCVRKGNFCYPLKNLSPTVYNLCLSLMFFTAMDRLLKALTPLAGDVQKRALQPFTSCGTNCNCWNALRFTAPEDTGGLCSSPLHLFCPTHYSVENKWKTAKHQNLCVIYRQQNVIFTAEDGERCLRDVLPQVPK